MLTPGLVNTHHHLYQWITRGLAADHTLFQWLTTLYPIWAGIDETAVHTAALGGIGQLVMSGCTTTTDHHYVFPREGGDLLGARSVPRPPSASDSIRPAGRWTSRRRTVACHPIRWCRASTRSSKPAPTRRALARPAPRFPAADRSRSVLPVLGHHRPAPRVRLAGTRTRRADAHPSGRVAGREHLLRPAFRLHAAAVHGVGGMGRDDVWFAHGIEFADDEIARLAATSTGVAHCPTSNARLATGSAAPASSSMPVYPSDSVSTARPPTSRRDCSRRRIKRC